MIPALFPAASDVPSAACSTPFHMIGDEDVLYSLGLHELAKAHSPEAEEASGQMYYTATTSQLEAAQPDDPHLELQPNSHMPGYHEDGQQQLHQQLHHQQQQQQQEESQGLASYPGGQLLGGRDPRDAGPGAHVRGGGMPSYPLHMPAHNHMAGGSHLVLSPYLAFAPGGDLRGT